MTAITTHQIFISHSHEDDLFCRDLVAALRAGGVDVWYDEHNLGSGQIGPIIERELRARRDFIVILSPAALRSRWVEDECRWAYTLYRQDGTRTILPVLASALPVDLDIWLFLADFKRIEAPGCKPYPKAEGIQRVLRALDLQLSSSTTSDPALPIAPTTVPKPPAANSATQNTQLDTSGLENQSLEELRRQGSQLTQKGRSAEALPFYERATQIAPNSFRDWESLVYAYLALPGQMSQARAAAERALAISERYLRQVESSGTPTTPNIWAFTSVPIYLRRRSGAILMVAVAWYLIGRTSSSPEEALDAFERAISLRPNLKVTGMARPMLFTNLVEKRKQERPCCMFRSCKMSVIGVEKRWVFSMPAPASDDGTADKQRSNAIHRIRASTRGLAQINSGLCAFMHAALLRFAQFAPNRFSARHIAIRTLTGYGSEDVSSQLENSLNVGMGCV